MSRIRASDRPLPSHVDIAIVTILPEEYEAVKRRLKNVRRDPGTKDQPNQYAWIVGEIEAAQGGTYQVVVAMTLNPGNTSGSLGTGRTVARWKPRYVLLVGIAGGIRREQLGLGNVVVSKQIVSYEYGKLECNAFNPRPDFVFQLDGSLLRSALSLRETDSWNSLGPRPGRDQGKSKVVVGMVGSGEKVIDNRSAEFFKAVEKVFSRLLAVEMEGAGAAAAIQEARDEGRTVGFLMIRGISDMPPDKQTRRKKAGEGLKKLPPVVSDRNRWKSYAASAAASFAVHFVSCAWPLPPQGEPEAGSDRKPSAAQRQQAQERYFAYLRSECGEIQLAGLPADEQVGARTLRLENLFVPLHLVEAKDSEGNKSRATGGPMSGMSGAPKTHRARRLPFGTVLAKQPRIAILAPPGGGKSTLLKRVAMAYAFPKRREELNDHLPQRRWLPVIVRCRELLDRAQRPIGEILAGTAERAEMKELGAAFLSLLNQALSKDELLLLVDGLDEIADEKLRTAFVHQLQTYLSLHPAVALILTSREAGFRIVAGTVAKHCQAYRLAEFNDEDIMRLTVAWHREVVGGQPKVLADAERLASTISHTDRVRRLARNPLLLTTILLVKRWVGELPSGRSALYQKAIEVLLMTWNVEAHAKLEIGEVVPQLAFLAFTMMNAGIQQVSERRLREILTDARQRMDDILAYVRESVDNLIRRVEHRSSLLVQSGHVMEEGRLWPLYEFRHLTFQEYLAALAVVEGYYPGHREHESLLSVLQPNLLDEKWKEVIPLAAVLAGRNARPLVEHLVEALDAHTKTQRRASHTARVRAHNPRHLLAQCLSDGVPLPRDLAERSLLLVSRGGDMDPEHESALISLLHSKYGTTLASLIRREYVREDGFSHFSGAMAAVASWRVRNRAIENKGDIELTASITMALADPSDPSEQALACLTVMNIAFQHRQRIESAPMTVARRTLMEFAVALQPLLRDARPFLHGGAAWAYAWLGECGAVDKHVARFAMARLFEIWHDSPYTNTRYYAAWAFSNLPLLPRGRGPVTATRSGIDYLAGRRVKKERAPCDRLRAATAGLLLEAPLVGRADRGADREGWTIRSRPRTRPSSSEDPRRSRGRDHAEAQRGDDGNRRLTKTSWKLSAKLAIQTTRRAKRSRALPTL